MRCTKMRAILTLLLILWALPAWGSQWTFRTGSFVSAGNASGNALSIAKPTGTASGDLVVFVVYWESDTNTVTGSDSLASALRQANTGAFMLEVFYKIAGGSEPATYTFTPATNGQWRAAVGAAYQNGTGSGPWVDTSGGSEGDSVITTSQTAPSVTTTSADCLVVFAYGNFSGSDPASTSGFATSFRGALGGATLADAAKATAGATGTTNPASMGSETYAAMHVAFISDTGGGGGGSDPPGKRTMRGFGR